MLRTQHIVTAGTLLLAACATTTAATSSGPLEPPAAAGSGAITGQVRDAQTGEPLSFATVMANRPGTVTEGPSATTDAYGQYRIDALAAGPYRVHVYYAALSVRWQQVDVQRGQDSIVDIDLSTAELREPPPVSLEGDYPTETHTVDAMRRRTGSIDGQVVDEATDEPLEGAVVAVTSSALRDAQLAVVDASGAFRVAALPPGTYTLSVSYQLIDYGTIEIRRSAVRVQAGETTTIPLRLDTSVQANNK